MTNQAKFDLKNTPLVKKNNKINGLHIINLSWPTSLAKWTRATCNLGSKKWKKVHSCISIRPSSSIVLLQTSFYVEINSKIVFMDWAQRWQSHRGFKVALSWKTSLSSLIVLAGPFKKHSATRKRLTRSKTLWTLRVWLWQLLEE